MWVIRNRLQMSQCRKQNIESLGQKKLPALKEGSR